MLIRLALCCVLLLVAACATLPPAPERPLTILVSIDGFRPDYLDRGVTPVLSGLAATGVRGALRPVFPSKTFPNHYSVVTGVSPDRHGVVDNKMEDPALPGVTFRMSNAAAVRDGRWWDGATPIWVTAERAGIASATMFWPGSEAEIAGVRPRYGRPFDQSVTPPARVDQVLAWLDLPPPQRPGFITLYFDDVDTAGHNHGPDSAEVNAAAARVDAALGALVGGLAARSLRANLVVVSDHGMSAMSPDRQVYLDDLLAPETYRLISGGTFVALRPAPGREAEVEAALLRRHERMQCWRKDQIPERLRYGRHPRVAPFICMPEAGWRLTTRAFRSSRVELGSHGFDPEHPEMAAIFVGHGPAFRPGVTLERLDLVSVYPLLAQLLGVRPEPNEGRLSELEAGLAR